MKKFLFRLSLSQWISIVALIIGILAAIYLESQPQATIPVPREDLPAYHLVKSDDLYLEKYAVKNIPSNAFTKTENIIDRYTLSNIPKKKPLIEKQLSSKKYPTRLADTFSVAIHATSAITFSGNLQPGDTVNITLVSAKSKTESTPSSIMFSNILVLDVKQGSQVSASFSPVIVIALPLKRQQEFATKLPGATIIISRKL